MKTTPFLNCRKAGYLSTVAAAFILAGCASSSPQVSQSGSGNTNARVVEPTLQNDCPLEKISWLVVNNQVDKAKMVSISKQLSEAALKDADKIHQMSTSNALLQLNSTLQTVVDANSQGQFTVNHEFYQEYINNRNSLCAVLEALRRGSIKKEESLKSAETAFRKISGSFEKFSNPTP